MKKIVKKTATYRCDKCRTTYETKKAAQKCERASVEKRAYRKGALVRTCAKRVSKCPCGRDYYCVGSVVSVLGPYPYDHEWLLKDYGIKPGPGHLYLYEIASDICPGCRKLRLVQYPAAVLQPVPSR